MWDRRDKVKSFHSKMLISDALNERDLQMEIKGAQIAHRKDRDAFFDQQIVEKCTEYDRQEAIKKKQIDEKRKLTQRVLKEQHDDFKVKHVMVLQEEILEGELIKRNAIEANARAKVGEEKRKAELMEANKASAAMNVIAKQHRLEQLQKEKEEDEKIRIYGLQKQKELDDRKEFEV
jgi:hypothetical protein